MFEDQLEQGKEYFENLSARVQESSLYNSIYERFTSFSPTFQKFILVALFGLFIFIILAKPIANYKTSVENLQEFEVRKKLTQQIIDFNKEKSNLAPAPKQISLSELSQKVSTNSQSYSIKLLPEQTNVRSSSGQKIIPQANQSDYVVNITKANIEQVTSLAYSINRDNKSLLISSIDFKANAEDPRYFDSQINVTNLYVNPISQILPEPEVEATPTSGRRRR